MTIHLPEFALSQDERLALAQHLRSTTLVETRMTPDLEADLDRVTVEERHVPTRVGPARVLIVRPQGPAAGPRPLFVNIHGGGFVRGYQRRDTIFCAHLATQLGCVVVDLDYRLAPEHPFPAALHEAYDVVAWAFREADPLGVDPRRIAVGGHSAGGNLTAAICLMANETGALRIRGQVMDYPFLDGVTPAEDKLEPHSIFPAERLRAFSVLYAGLPENLLDPLLSPVMAAPDALKGLPSAFVMTAGLDPLRHEARRYAAMLIDAGVDVTVRNFEDCDHGFLIACQGRFREGRAALVAWLHSIFEN
jgi:acetyl esterase